MNLAVVNKLATYSEKIGVQQDVGGSQSTNMEETSNKGECKNEGSTVGGTISARAIVWKTIAASIALE